MAQPPPPSPRPVATLRAEIDGVDHAILRLLARRRALVAEAFARKDADGAPHLDPARERALLDERRAYAEGLGLPAELSQAVFTAVLDDSHRRA